MFGWLSAQSTRKKLGLTAGVFLKIQEIRGSPQDEDFTPPGSGKEHL